MAGFFGLINYEKEGPGVEKNAPKKNGFIVFFETFFRNFWKLIAVNLVYVLISIPIVTGGLAAVGITNVTRNIALQKHSFGLSDFFDTIKKNFKQSLIAGIINAIIFALLLFAGWFYGFAGNKLVLNLALGVVIAAFIVFSIMNIYIWTMLITFKMPLKNIYRNSFKFVFLNLKMNLLYGIIMIIVYGGFAVVPFVCGGYWPLALTVEMVLAATILPGFRFLLIQFCTFNSIRKFIIDPYYAEHPEDDIELRRSLGLSVPEKYSKKFDEDDTVFEDNT